MSAKRRGHGWKMLRLRIDGMHCANCEVLVERRFRNIAGVRRVNVSNVTGTAEINCYGDIDVGTLQRAIADDGYTVSLLREETSKPSNSANRTNTGRDYAEIAAAFAILIGVYLLLGQLDVLPQNLTLPNDISYGFALLIGVAASMSTCIAVTGGLLVAVAAKYNAATTQLGALQRFKPHLFFNAGRVASYTLLGGAIGALGSTFSMSARANALLMILASAIMIVLGLQMLNLFPWLKLLQPRMPKVLAHKIHDVSEKEVKGGAFLLGASTFFLPCGFTQALQLYVLAKGSFMTGALTMLAFSLGTLPALISLSALSSFAKGSFQRYFLKFAGVAVVMLGLFNLQSGFTLSAVGTEGPTATFSEANSTSQPSVQPVPIVDGKQVVDMKIVGYRYEPHQFAVVQGIPVEWRIDARYGAGCGHILIAPRIGLRRFLSFSDVTVISFTPQKAGEINFNCGMGMMTRGSKITVRPSTAALTPEDPARPAQAFSANQSSQISGASISRALP
jgi:sulfite exporter TauE/SafE/copper chaperone CopZ